MTEATKAKALLAATGRAFKVNHTKQMEFGVHPTSLQSLSVRQQNGLFSLNDLHRASGGESRHQPHEFLRIEQTRALVAELNSGESRNCVETRRGANGGTYACRELVIAYADWISAAFHLKVIRVFLSASEPAAQRIALAERATRALLDAIDQHPDDSRFVVDLRGHAQAIAQDQMLISWAELAGTVADANTLLSNAELATLNQACAARLARRLAH